MSQRRTTSVVSAHAMRSACVPSALPGRQRGSGSGVERVHVRHPLLERRHVRNSDEYDRAAQLARVDAVEKVLGREDWRVLIAVHSGGERKGRPGRAP